MRCSLASNGCRCRLGRSEPASSSTFVDAFDALAITYCRPWCRPGNSRGGKVIAGHAARPDVLKAANPPLSKCIIVAIPEAFEAGQVVPQARAANPKSHIIARAHSDAEVEHLNGLGADAVIMGEREIAREMLHDYSARQGHKPDQA